MRIVVVSDKGGVGKSVIASSLAVYISRVYGDALAVDLSPMAGVRPGLAWLLNVPPTPGRHRSKYGVDVVVDDKWRGRWAEDRSPEVVELPPGSSPPEPVEIAVVVADPAADGAALSVNARRVYRVVNMSLDRRGKGHLAYSPSIYEAYLARIPPIIAKSNAVNFSLWRMQFAKLAQEIVDAMSRLA